MEETTITVTRDELKILIEALPLYNDKLTRKFTRANLTHAYRETLIPIREASLELEHKLWDAMKKI